MQETYEFHERSLLVTAGDSRVQPRLLASLPPPASEEGNKDLIDLPLSRMASSVDHTHWGVSQCCQFLAAFHISAVMRSQCARKSETSTSYAPNLNVSQEFLNNLSWKERAG